MKKLVIFDFDGTLVDSVTDVAICFNNALTALGFPMRDIASIQSSVGGNLEQVVSRLLPEDQRTAANIDAVKILYRKIYMDSDKSNTKPYPGICDLLDRLRQQHIFLAINTNKGQALVDALTGKLFPDHVFASIVGYDERYPSKPDPFGVHSILASCQVTAHEAVYVGDGKSDIDTAKAADLDILFVTWGQGTEEDRQSVPADRVVDTPEGIYQYVMEES